MIPTKTRHPQVRIRPSPTRRRSAWPVLALAGFLGGCDDGTPADPGTLRFGQVGSVEIVLSTPSEQLPAGIGEHRQRLVWNSDGTWTLTDILLYEGIEGDTDVVTLSSNQEVSANIYGEWITQVSENEGLDLFVDELDPFLDPTCTDLRARLTLTIRDHVRDEAISWTRCASQGPLSQLTPANAGPDAEAARVVSAAQLVRDRTVGAGFVSGFTGSFPFATIDRGENSGAALTGPLVIDDPVEWIAFWAEHSRSQGAPPQVDFDRDVVLVAAVGTRFEAGDSVEVQSWRSTGSLLQMDYHQRVPGNFCSPAEKAHVPYHVVRAPRLPLPVEFSEQPVQRFPCG